MIRLLCLGLCTLLGCSTKQEVDVPEGCGNEILEEGEQCDPPSDIGCSSTCRIEPSHLNRCPELRFLFVSPRQAKIGEAFTLEADIVDPDGDEISIRWEAPGGLFEDADQASTTYTCKKAGPRLLGVRFSDDHGCEADSSVEVRCLP